MIQSLWFGIFGNDTYSIYFLAGICWKAFLTSSDLQWEVWGRLPLFTSCCFALVKLEWTFQCCIYFGSHHLKLHTYSFLVSFQVKMMLMKVIARTVGLHHLILLNFYPYLQRYVQVSNYEISFGITVDISFGSVLSHSYLRLVCGCSYNCSPISVMWQICLLQRFRHVMIWYGVFVLQFFFLLLNLLVFSSSDDILFWQVPPDAVEPLFKQVVNQFVHDRSRPEVSNMTFISH